jgi:hypothetical protein
LEELGHPQPPTPMEKGNTNATGYSNGTIKNIHKSNGYAILLDQRQSKKGNLMCIRARATKIWQIISQNIIRLHIIKECKKYTFTQTNSR